VTLCPEEGAALPMWIGRLSDTIYQWEVAEGSVAADGTARKIRQVYLKKVSARAYELDGPAMSWQTDTFEYDVAPGIIDRRANVRTVRIERGDGTGSETTNEYAQDDASRWLFGRLTKSTVVKTGDPVGARSAARRTETRVTGFSYDAATGLLASETAHLGDPQAVTTAYARDMYGNIVTSTITTSGERPRVWRRTLDAYGRFPVALVNPLGHVVRIVSRPTTGLPERRTDENELVTTYMYDGFGRLRTVVPPSGVKKTLEYLDLDQLGDQAAIARLPAAYAMRATTEGLPPVVQILDSKARVLREISNGFSRDGAAFRPVQKDLVYDVAGRLVRSSLPYDRGAKVLWTEMEYDVLSRVVLTRSPDGSITKAQFAGRADGGRVSTLVDPLNRVTRTEINMRNLPIVSTDALKGTVRYAYDAGDRIESIVGPTGAVTRSEYNSVGHRIRTADPDLGTWSYEYNGYGGLTRQTDAKNQVTTIDYDLLGRPTRRVERGATSYWEYDSARRGVGQLAAVRRSDGYVREFYYDTLGRPSASAVTIGGEQFVTRTDLDRYGRRLRTYYPVDAAAGSIVVVNVYDAKGFLVKITNLEGSEAYWQAKSVDEVGRVTVEAYGNGVETKRRFNAERGHLESLQSKGATGGTVLDLTVAYDTVGNLRERVEKVDGIRETFSYDALDRLIGTKRADGTTESYTFDAAGRMRSKSGVGEYSYAVESRDTAAAGGRWQPFHAVLATRSGNVAQKYDYDANGNLVSRPGTRFEYTDDNRLQHLFVDQAHWSRFDYAPDGHRFRQSTRNGAKATETIYAAGYERITEAVGLVPAVPSRRFVRHRYHLVNADGVFATIETSIQYLDPDFDPVTPGTGNTVQKRKVWYLHQDQLTSVVRMTGESGRMVAKFWYDPWGGKRVSKIFDPAGGPAGDRLGDSWTRSFTGHEYLEQFALVHMNGRVYDTRTGMFTSADPVALNGSHTQALGRYRYGLNNPLRYTDPTGYWSWGGALTGAITGFVTGGPAGAGAGFVIGGNDDSRRFVEENWRQVVIVGVAIGVTVVTGGAGGTVAAAILSGMAAGAASGALSAALYGGSFEDVLAGAIKGAVIGGISAGAFYGVGSAFSGEAGAFGGPDSLGAVAGHGVVGGATESAQGGDFWTGFAAAAVTKASGVYGPQFSGTEANIVRAAVVGGTVSTVTGGKFANGALTGAFSYAFNDALHKAIDVEKAVVYLDRNAAECSQGKCARAVREAIEAGGTTLTRPSSGDAKDYGPSLEAAGFTKVPKENYVPLKGDVIVLQPPTGRTSGHIQMWNGTRWESDFKQSTDLYPGPGYRKDKVKYEIYRP
jgi:RHS repeat-associated protein